MHLTIVLAEVHQVRHSKQVFVLVITCEKVTNGLRKGLLDDNGFAIDPFNGIEICILEKPLPWN